MTKIWLSYDEQIELLRSRGMIISDDAECQRFLSSVGYYRLSNYFRYWQQSPQLGEKTFIAGTNFNTIRDVYLAEQQLTGQAMIALKQIELLLRAQFAHHYAQRITPCGALTFGKGFTLPPVNQPTPVAEYIMRELQRSKEPFIAHYRDETQKNLKGDYLPEAYADMPVWAAVEVLSFGVLSRCIQASKQSGVLGDIAVSVGVSQKHFAGQIKSFVYLRNRIAHNSRIWNNFVPSPPGIPTKIKRRVTRRRGRFGNQSVYQVLVAMDKIMQNSGLEPKWLTASIDSILAKNVILARGIIDPKKYDLNLSVSLHGNSRT